MNSPSAAILQLILKRLAMAIPTLLLISLISFALINAAPGDALAELKQDPRISQETVNRLRAQAGLDRPLLARYGTWLNGAVRGDFGRSISERLPVTTLIGARLGNTLKLSLTATFLALLIALPLGALTAKQRGSWLDRIIGALTLVSLSTPRIVLAIIALVFAARTGLFPIGNVRSLNIPNDWSAASILDSWHHLLLPAVVMSLPLAAVYLRQARADLLEVLAADFIQLCEQHHRTHLLAVNRDWFAMREPDRDVLSFVSGVLRRTRQLKNILGRFSPGVFQNSAFVRNMHQVPIH